MSNAFRRYACLSLLVTLIWAGPANAQLLGDTIHGEYITHGSSGPSQNWFDPAVSSIVPFGANPLQPDAIVADDDLSYVEFTTYFRDPVSQSQFEVYVDVDDSYITIEFRRTAWIEYHPFDITLSELGDGTALTNMVVIRNDTPATVTHDATSMTLSSSSAWSAVAGSDFVLISIDGITDAPPAGRAVLEQNVPNPFNPATVIPFRLANPGPVELEIFDVRGQRVRTLASRAFEAGRHEIRWDGTDDRGAQVNSGVYVYRLSTSAGVQSSKMSLIR